MKKQETRKSILKVSALLLALVLVLSSVPLDVYGVAMFIEEPIEHTADDPTSDGVYAQFTNIKYYQPGAKVKWNESAEQFNVSGDELPRPMDNGQELDLVFTYDVVKEAGSAENAVLEPIVTEIPDVINLGETTSGNLREDKPNSDRVFGTYKFFKDPIDGKNKLVLTFNENAKQWPDVRGYVKLESRIDISEMTITTPVKYEISYLGKVDKYEWLIRPIEHTSITKQADVATVGEDGVVNYTVIVNTDLNKYDTAEQVFTDVLEEPLQYVAGSFKIYPMETIDDAGKPLATIKNGKPVWGDNAFVAKKFSAPTAVADTDPKQNKIKYTIDDLDEKAYKIEYQAKLKDNLAQGQEFDIKNVAAIAGQSSTASVAYSTAWSDDVISKKGDTDLDYNPTAINWQITVNPERGKLTKVEIVDDIPSAGELLRPKPGSYGAKKVAELDAKNPNPELGLPVLADVQVLVEDEAGETTPYQPASNYTVFYDSENERKLKIVFADDVVINDKIIIEYSTPIEYMNDSNYSITKAYANRAALTSDERNGSASAVVNVKYHCYIYKHVVSRTPDVNGDYTIKYRVFINKGQRNLHLTVLKDALYPETGHYFKEGTVKVWPAKINKSNGRLIKSGKSLDISKAISVGGIAHNPQFGTEDDISKNPQESQPSGAESGKNNCLMLVLPEDVTTDKMYIVEYETIYKPSELTESSKSRAKAKNSARLWYRSPYGTAGGNGGTPPQWHSTVIQQTYSKFNDNHTITKYAAVRRNKHNKYAWDQKGSFKTFRDAEGYSYVTWLLKGIMKEKTVNNLVFEDRFTDEFTLTDEQFNNITVKSGSSYNGGKTFKNVNGEDYSAEKITDESGKVVGIRVKILKQTIKSNYYVCYSTRINPANRGNATDVKGDFKNAVTLKDDEEVLSYDELQLSLNAYQQRQAKKEGEYGYNKVFKKNVIKWAIDVNPFNYDLPVGPEPYLVDSIPSDQEYFDCRVYGLSEDNYEIKRDGNSFKLILTKPTNKTFQVRIFTRPVILKSEYENTADVNGVPVSARVKFEIPDGDFIDKVSAKGIQEFDAGNQVEYYVDYKIDILKNQYGDWRFNKMTIIDEFDPGMTVDEDTISLVDDGSVDWKEKFTISTNGISSNSGKAISLKLNDGAVVDRHLTLTYRVKVDPRKVNSAGSGGMRLANTANIVASYNDSGEVDKKAIVIAAKNMAITGSVAGAGAFKIVKREGKDPSAKGIGQTEFELFKVGDEKSASSLNSIGQFATGSDGTKEISGLQVGTYVIKENKPADGYSLDGAKYQLNGGKWADYSSANGIKFTISDSRVAQQAVEVVMTNSTVKHALTIVKKAKHDEELTLNGAVFNVYKVDLDGSGNPLASTMAEIKTGVETAADGRLTVDDLLPGHYLIEEKQAPDNYQPFDGTAVSGAIKIGDKWYMPVTFDKTSETQKKTVTFVNEVEHRVKVVKVSDKIQNGRPEPLAGATFELTGTLPDGTPFTTLSKQTDKAGHIVFGPLPHGSYTLKETAAPKGYQLDASAKTFDINENSDPLQRFEFINSSFRKLRITKTDDATAADGGNPVEGLIFKLTKPGGAEELLKATGEDGTTEIALDYANYPDGTYTVTEVSIDGKPISDVYRTAQNQTIEINSTGGTIQEDNSRLFTLDFHNVLRRYVQVYKASDATVVTSGSAIQIDESVGLGGAEFEVVDSDDKVVTKLTTGQNGLSERYYLDGDYGDYRVREVKAPLNHYKSDDVLVRTVGAGSPVDQVLTFVDEQYKLVKIKKVDGSTMEPLNGVDFKISVKTVKEGTVTPIATTQAGITVEATTPGGLVIGGEPSNTTQSGITVDGDVVVTPPAVDVFNTTFTTGRFGEEDGVIMLLLPKGLGVVQTVTIEEVKALDGYLLNEGAITKTKALGQSNVTWFVFDQVKNYKKRYVRVHKTDDSYGTDGEPNHQPLAGVRFAVHGAASGKQVGTIITNDQGVAELQLPDGAYYLRELTVDDKYFPNLQNYDFTITGDPDNAAYQQGVVDGVYRLVEVINYLKRTITVDKVDDAEANGVALKRPVAGATIELYYYNNADGSEVVVDTIKTGADGKAIFKDIDIRKATRYFAREKAAPEKYIKTDQVLEFVVDGSAVDVPAQEMVNALKRSIRIRKVDAADETTGLAGAAFKVTDEVGSVVADNLVTDEDGYAMAEGLAKGVYFVSEVEPPSGYVVNDDNSRRVEIDAESEVFDVVISNRKDVDISIKTGDKVEVTRKIIVYKRDAESGELLPGARFRLALDGDLIAEGNTNEAGIIEFDGLATGQYTLIELSAPAGYVPLEEELTVDVDDSAVVFELDVYNDLQTTPEENPVDPKVETGEPKAEQVHDIIVYKRDAKTAELLSGATFRLTLNGKTVAEKATGQSGSVTFSGLKEGAYSLAELTAPAGYILNGRPIDVVVDSSQSSFEVDVYNEPAAVLAAATHGIRVYKRDAQTSQLLPGATFRLTLNGTVIAEKTTNASGVAEFSGLQEGRYVLTELVAPIGYQLNTAPSTIVVDDTQSVFEVAVYNEPQPVVAAPPTTTEVLIETPSRTEERPVKTTEEETTEEEMTEEETTEKMTDATIESEVSEPETTEPEYVEDDEDEDDDEAEVDKPAYLYNKIPNPNDPNSPEEIIVVDEDGIPLGAYKKHALPTGEVVYISEDGVALGTTKLVKTGNDFPEKILLIIAILAIVGALILMKREKKKFDN